MFNYLEKLRHKPDSAKKHFAFLVSFSFVGIIFVIWLSVIYPGFIREKKVNDRIVANDPSPFSTFSSVLSQSFDAIGGQMSKIQEIGSSLLSGTEYISTGTATTTE